MAEFTYETRRKISENWVAQTKKNASGVPKSETGLLPDTYYYSLPQKTCNKMRELLENGA